MTETENYVAALIALLVSLGFMRETTQPTPTPSPEPTPTPTPVTYQLTTSTDGHGTITPFSGRYTQGITVTLVATPNSGYELPKLILDGVAISNNYSLVMDKDHSVSVSFSQIVVPPPPPPPPVNHNFSVSIGMGSGTVSPSPGNYSAVDGTVLYIVASPSSGYAFQNYSVNSTSFTQNPLSLTLISDVQIIVNFSPVLPPPPPSPGTGKKLGTWENIDKVAAVSASSFAPAYFLNSPFTFLYVMVPSLKPSYYWLVQGQAWINSLASIVDGYNNCEIVPEISINDLTDEAGWTALQNFINMTKAHKCIKVVGAEGEYFDVATSPIHGTASAWTRLSNMITSAGKEFISYYHPPAPYKEISHTNYPNGGPQAYDPESTLDGGDKTRCYGISTGYYYTFPFPEPRPLPPPTQTAALNYGWNQAAVDNCLAHFVKFDNNFRRYCALCLGFGPSTISNLLCFNTTLRSWILSNSAYQLNFLRSQ